MENTQTVDARYSSGKFGPQRLARYIGQTVSAGADRRRLRVQDQHAPAPIAEIEGDKYALEAEAFAGRFTATKATSK